MKEIFLLSAFALFFGLNTAQSQNYGSAIGLRGGSGITASYKVFLGERPAFEVFGGIRSNSSDLLYAGLIYEHHLPIGEFSNFSFYYGGGGQTILGDGFALGASGAIGLDYAFENIPLNLSLDWLPTIGLIGFGDTNGVPFGGLSVRYIISE